MFGIGLPELILIMAVALIVVGPDKLPDLAKTLARQLLELKKAGQQLKESLNEEVNKEDLKPWEQIPPTTPKTGDAIEDTFQVVSSKDEAIYPQDSSKETDPESEQAPEENEEDKQREDKQGENK